MVISYVKGAAALFRQPLSRLTATAPRSGSLLACATAPKASLSREVAASNASRRRELKLAVPVYGESGTKCRKGCGVEVDFAKQKTEGVSLP